MPASTRDFTSSRKFFACPMAQSVPRSHCAAITLVICSFIRTGVFGALQISSRTSSKYSSCRFTPSIRARRASGSNLRPVIRSSSRNQSAELRDREIEPMRLE